MWNARLSRRELIELMLGASKPRELTLQQATGGVTSASSDSIEAYWENDPRSSAISLPNLIVLPEGGDTELLVALNSSPQAPTPVTGLSRILTHKEARDLFGKSLLSTSEDVLPLIVALTMAEAVLHSEGRLSLRQVTPAVCKRTLSYAWGKALAQGTPASIENLPARWIEAYALISGSAPPPAIRMTVGSLIGVLGACAQIGLGIQPSGPVGKLAFSIGTKDRIAQESAWHELSQSLGISLSLDKLASSTREERGIHLQQAVTTAGQGATDDKAQVACAFLATQVAPRSLEHLEVLRTVAHPSVVFWYAMFAALQAPSDILAANGGVGLRVLRDLSKVEDCIARPSADIAFSELKALERVGIDSVARKFGHLGEVEVELIPLVTSSFSYPSRLSKAKAEAESQEFSLVESGSASRRESSTKNRMQKALALMAELIRELPEQDEDSVPTSESKRGGTIGGRRAKAGRDGK